MAIKSVLHPETGVLGYTITVSLGRINGRCRYHSKTFYGITVIEAQKIESEMDSHAKRCRNAASISEVYRAYIKQAQKKSIELKKGFAKSQEKPGAFSTPEKIRVRKSYWMDFVKWMKKNNPLIKKMSDVTPVMAENYIAFIQKNGRFAPVRGKGGLSSFTLNDILHTCRRVFRSLRHEIGIDNPFEDIKPVKSKTQSRLAYNQEQLQVIFEKADKEYLYPMFFIGLFTGLSEGDVCTLKKSEIVFSRRHIYHKRNKTGVMSNIPILPVLQKFLEELCSDPDNTTDHLLPNHYELYSTKRYQISRDIKNFLEFTCGFETTVKVQGRKKRQSVLDFHSLRHTFCSMAGIAGIPLTVVQSIVGHMNVEMTKLYSQHVEEADRLKWIDLFGESLKTLPIGYNSDSQDIAERIENLDSQKLKKIIDILNS